MPEICVLTREQLFDRVWTTAMRKLAPELGVSDVGLKKICRRFDIPTPPVGYWAKKEVGKAPRRPKLPDVAEACEINFYPGDGSGAAADVEAVATREKLAANQIEVTSDLTSLHPLVEKTRSSLLSAKPGEDGLVEPRAKKTLNIAVAPGSIDRACRIMDALLVALEERSTPMNLVRNDDYWATSVAIRDERIDIGVHEIVDRVERDPTPAEEKEIDRWSWSKNKKFYNQVPTGRLCLEIFSGPPRSGRRRRYSDSNKRPLEHLLNSFIVALHRVAEDIKVERRQQEELARQRAEAERQRQEFERQRVKKVLEIQREERRLESLIREAENWERSQSIRRFVDACRSSVINRDGRVIAGSKADEWIRWATSHADRLDPLVVSPPSILDEKEKWSRHRPW